MSFSGVLHNGSLDGSRVHLPLQQLRVRVMIVDVSTRVTLTQVFRNDSEYATGRAAYYFPVPATAAICAFQMKLEDGRIIKGISESKDHATARFNEAIAQGKTAGKVDLVTGDIFTISLGSIPARQTVETRLEFVMTLLADDNVDDIRFQLPMHVGARYGVMPQELIEAQQAAPQTRVKIVTEVQMRGSISDIRSPSHAITETKYSTHLGRPSRRRSTVTFESDSFLQKDFVLIVNAEGLDEPRCFAELEGNPRNSGHATLALQLMIMPKFRALNVISRQEYLFLIDRSGSMQGDRMETAKDTLCILLRMLPPQHTTFNIFSFGNICDAWSGSGSMKYTQQTLEAATVYVNSMQADYGGTEIYGALKFMLSGRQKKVPTAVFVLTDGEVDATLQLASIEYIRQGAQSAPPRARMRLYTLGIGDGVSSALCQGLATAGDGDCLFAVTTESIIGKCARLLRAGRTSFVQNVKIDWGIPSDALDTPTVQFSIDQSPTGPVRLKPPPAVQQAPTAIRDIHAGVRLVVFAILRLGKLSVPKYVTLHGQVEATGEVFQERVPIRGVELKDLSKIPLVHTLAASRLIRELESGMAPLPKSYVPTTDVARLEAGIIRLGEQYQLASQHTSFVAVHDGSQDSGSVQESHHSFENRQGSEIRPGPIVPTNSTSSFIEGLIGRMREVWSTPEQTSTMPGDWPFEDPEVEEAGDQEELFDAEEGYSTDGSFTSLSSLDGTNSWWSEVSEESEPERGDPSGFQRVPSPQFKRTTGAPEPPQQTQSAPPLPVDQHVVELVKLQLADGSFGVEVLRGIAPQSVLSEATTLGVTEKVWATLISIAFIRKRMGRQKELANDLAVKALEFCIRTLGKDERVKELLDYAESLL